MEAAHSARLPPRMAQHIQALAVDVYPTVPGHDESIVFNLQLLPRAQTLAWCPYSSVQGIENASDLGGVDTVPMADSFRLPLRANNESVARADRMRSKDRLKASQVVYSALKGCKDRRFQNLPERDADVEARIFVFLANDRAVALAHQQTGDGRRRSR